ncbi:molybdopterin-binding oxidoreductase, partial [Streptomyces sp. NPDC001919]
MTLSAPRRAPTRTDRLLAAAGGLVAGYVSLAVADLASFWARPEASPVTAVGGAVVDRTPAAVKEWAIRQFGESDKAVLQLGILLVLGVLAAAVGLLALRRRLLGSAAVGVFGLLGALAAVTRPDSDSALDAVPSLAGAAVGAALLYALTGILTRRAGTGPAAARADRRTFLVAAASAGLAATGAAAVARAVGSP